MRQKSGRLLKARGLTNTLQQFLASRRLAVQSMEEKTASEESSEHDIEIILRYHEETKHHFNRYAKSSGFMDWANQPSPWRIFERSPTTHLTTDPPQPSVPYQQLYHLHSCTQEKIERDEKEKEQLPANPHLTAPLDITSISCFLYHALALSAWKKYKDSSWSLRVNPSSGNLHPTEGYLILPSMEGLPEGGSATVYHYLPLSHSLEHRCTIAQPESDTFFSWGFRHIADASSLHNAKAFFVALTSIHWRESWKYGERAYRYCNHDVGHAYGAVRFAASLMGWQVILLNGTTDASLAALLGTDRSAEFRTHEGEEPDLLALVIVSDASEGEKKKILPCKGSEKWDIPHEIVEAMKTSTAWQGKAKLVSKNHVDWKIIREAASAAEKRVVSATNHDTEVAAREPAYLLYEQLPLEYREFMTTKTASEIIRQRRSAQDFDGTTSITRGQFYGILSRVVPALTEIPWDGWPQEWGVKVHLALFVHRVEGLPPGLYFLLRDESQLEVLKKSMKHEKDELVQFEWIRIGEEHGAPSGLPLYLLARGDVRNPAQRVSCDQEIAGDGAFSLGMIADFEDTIRQEGAHAYRRLFWETGLIGQVLYLEAEAQGIRGTGIGCFFDDPVHRIFGFARNRKYQSLYHFTMGGPVEDTRLRTLRAYKAEE